jgi:hypothetical protein
LADSGPDAVHLFQPKETWRLQRYRPISGDPLPRGIVQYGASGASQIFYEVTENSDGEPETLIFNAGSNPPDGVVVQYYLNEAPEGDLSLTFLDAEGNTIRTFPNPDDPGAGQPPAKAGLNRFVWNLRYPGATPVTASELEPWAREDGPRVVPGSYQVQLTVGDASQTQSFEVVLDPRVTTSAGDLAEQRDFLLDVRDRLSATNQLLNQVDAVRDQLKLWSTRSLDPAMSDQLTELTATLDTMRTELIDVRWGGPQLWPTGVHEKLSALLESADGADFAPPRQAREVFEQLSAQLDDLRQQFDNLQQSQIAALNNAIQAADVPIIGV